MNCGGHYQGKRQDLIVRNGKIPGMAEYMEAVKGLEPMASDIYRYLSFDQITEYREVAEKVIPIRAA